MQFFTFMSRKSFPASLENLTPQRACGLRDNSIFEREFQVLELDRRWNPICAGTRHAQTRRADALNLRL